MARTGQGPPRYARGDQHYRQTCRPSCQKPEYTDEYGIVALSAKDRSYRRETVVIPSVRRTGQRAEETFHVVAATSEAVVINVGGDAIHGTDWDTFDDPQVRTIGLDPRTGKELWSGDVSCGGCRLRRLVRGSQPQATSGSCRLSPWRS
ncbi:hypothetical protein ACQBAR_17100 [Propionibacteriaceae bacterium Y1685]